MHCTHAHIHFLFILYSEANRSLVWSKNKVGNGNDVIEPADSLGRGCTHSMHTQILPLLQRYCIYHICTQNSLVSDKRYRLRTSPKRLNEATY